MSVGLTCCASVVFGRRVREGGSPPEVNGIYNGFYHCCAPLLGGRSGGMHMGVLDYYVRTGPRCGQSGVVRGCIAPVLCDVCGLPLKRCRCRVGVDY